MAFLAVVLLPAFEGPSSDGGNTAALAACRSIYVCFRLAASDHGDSPVSILDFSPLERSNFRQVAGLRRIPHSKLLVTSEHVRVGEGAGRKLIAVCDTAFDNVPRHKFGRAPMSHAVAYADGSTGLLSVSEFRHLDLRGFVDVSMLPDPKTEQPEAHETPLHAQH